METHVDLETPIQSNLTYTDVKKMLKDIREFAIQNDDRFLGPVQGLLNLADKCIIEKQSQKKQTS